MKAPAIDPARVRDPAERAGLDAAAKAFAFQVTGNPLFALAAIVASDDSGLAFTAYPVAHQYLLNSARAALAAAVRPRARSRRKPRVDPRFADLSRAFGFFDLRGRRIFDEYARLSRELAIVHEVAAELRPGQSKDLDRVYKKVSARHGGSPSRATVQRWFKKWRPFVEAMRKPHIFL